MAGSSIVSFMHGTVMLQPRSYSSLVVLSLLLGVTTFGVGLAVRIPFFRSSFNVSSVEVWWTNIPPASSHFSRSSSLSSIKTLHAKGKM